MARRQAKKAKPKHRKPTRSEKHAKRIEKARASRIRRAAARRGWETRRRNARAAAAKRGWETRRAKERKAEARRETRRARQAARKEAARVREIGPAKVEVDGVPVYASRDALFKDHRFHEIRSAFGTLEEALDFISTVGGGAYWAILMQEHPDMREPLFSPVFLPEKQREWNPTQHRRVHSGGRKQRTRLQQEQPDLFE